MENEYDEDIVEYEEHSQEEADVNDTLLNLELQISEDRTDVIKIRENDDANEVVDKFCEKYGYGSKVKNMIMERLVDALNTNITESIKYLS